MRKLYTLLLVSAITTSLYANNGADSLSSEACVADPAETVVFSMGFESGEGTVSIFPNPVKSFATISFTYENVDKISILNIVGREIKTVTPEAGKQEIKVSLVDLQPGVYFLAAYYQGNTLITKKFLKEE
ncbi:MAG: T9SS type A sorting domain-containing protein [Bacteroidetes bacterium]|nr:T9SS type A sorting domain-containing protein [Bacteroidota bacterium]MBK8346066.1 T9SS type A sorting domain-containing protein [Bacteroidota bacterium]